MEQSLVPVTTDNSPPVIFIAPFDYGGGSLSQGPHTILAVRNQETHYHRLIAEIPLHYYNPDLALQNITSALVTSGLSRYVVLGGSHLVTLGVLRARHQVDGPVHLVLYDAHSDDYQTKNPLLHGGNWVPFALSEGLLSGITWLNYRGLSKWGVRPTRGTPVHVSVDIDVLEASQYGGAARYLEPGGCSLSELLNSISETKGKKITADLVEYDPLLDTPGRFGGKVASRILSSLIELIGA